MWAASRRSVGDHVVDHAAGLAYAVRGLLQELGDHVLNHAADLAEAVRNDHVLDHAAGVAQSARGGHVLDHAADSSEAVRGCLVGGRDQLRLVELLPSCSMGFST